MNFTLWIETEHVQEPIDDFCKILVSLESGGQWALNVWTFDFFETARTGPELLATPELAGVYMFP